MTVRKIISVDGETQTVSGGSYGNLPTACISPAECLGTGTGSGTGTGPGGAGSIIERIEYTYRTVTIPISDLAKIEFPNGGPTCCTGTGPTGCNEQGYPVDVKVRQSDIILPISATFGPSTSQPAGRCACASDVTSYGGFDNISRALIAVISDNGLPENNNVVVYLNWNDLYLQWDGFTCTSKTFATAPQNVFAFTNFPPGSGCTQNTLPATPSDFVTFTLSYVPGGRGWVLRTCRGTLRAVASFPAASYPVVAGAHWGDGSTNGNITFQPPGSVVDAAPLEVETPFRLVFDVAGVQNPVKHDIDSFTVTIIESPTCIPIDGGRISQLGNGTLVLPDVWDMDISSNPLSWTHVKVKLTRSHKFGFQWRGVLLTDPTFTTLTTIYVQLQLANFNRDSENFAQFMLSFAGLAPGSSFPGNTVQIVNVLPDCGVIDPIFRGDNASHPDTYSCDPLELDFYNTAFTGSFASGNYIIVNYILGDNTGLTTIILTPSDIGEVCCSGEADLLFVSPTLNPSSLCSQPMQPITFDVNKRGYGDWYGSTQFTDVWSNPVHCGSDPMPASMTASFFCEDSLVSKQYYIHIGYIGSYDPLAGKTLTVTEGFFMTGQPPTGTCSPFAQSLSAIGGNDSNFDPAIGPLSGSRLNVND